MESVFAHYHLTRSAGKKPKRHRKPTSKFADMTGIKQPSKSTPGTPSTSKIKKECTSEKPLASVSPNSSTPTNIKYEYSDETPVFPPKRLNLGERRHQFACPYCWVSTKDQVTLDIHMQLHTQTHGDLKKYGEFRFRCNKCPSYGVYRRSHVERHMRHHKLLESRNWGTMEVGPDKQTFYCNFCDYGTMKIFNLVKHVPCCKGYKAGNKPVLKASALCHNILETQEKPKQSSSNGSAMSKKLVEKSKRLMVKKSQKKNPELVAPVVNKGDSPGVLISSSKLTNVMFKYRVDGTFKRHRCRICGYESNNVGHVVRHMVVHRKDKKKWPYKCTQCSASFSIVGNLVQHLKVHSGEKGSFVCELCNKTYHSKEGLYKHNLRFHTNDAKGGKIKTSTTTKSKKNKKMKSKGEQSDIKLESYDPFAVDDGPLNLQTHKCPQCGYIAQTVILLKIHIRDYHSPQKSIQCPECSYTTTEKCNLVRHAKLEHGVVDETYQCSQCEFIANTKSQLAIHMTQHNGRNSFMCKECFYVTNSCEDLAEHAKQHVKENAFKCPSCPYATFQKADYDVHVSAHGAKEDHQCQYCDFAVSTLKSLEIHLHSHVKAELLSCDMCNYTTNNKASYEWHVRCHSDTTLFKCDLCESRFQKKGSLLLHMRMHKMNDAQENGESFTPTNSFASLEAFLADDTGVVRKCDHCDFQTTQPVVLAQHSRTAHAEAMPFKCGLCGFATPKLTNYYQHMRRFHIDHGTRYKCPECDFVGTQKSDMVVHMRTHSGEKPFECNLCPYKTTRNSLLTQHKRQHTGEKPFKCTKCTYTTSTYNNWIRHMRCHSGEKSYPCHKCDFTTGQRSHLYRHVNNVHAGNKPLMCSMCGFSTAYASEIKRHEAQHFHQSAHKCRFCTFSTSRKYALTRHENSCHRKIQACEEEEQNQDIEMTPTQTMIEMTPTQTMIEMTPTQTMIEMTPTQTVIETPTVCELPLAVEEMTPTQTVIETPTVCELPLAAEEMTVEEMTPPVVEQPHPILDYTGVDAAGGEQPQHVCQFCDRRFDNEDDWNKHVKRHFMQWPQAENPAELMATIQASAGLENDNLEMLVVGE